MGYYIQGSTTNKAGYCVDYHGAVIIPQPKSLAEVPEGKALVCVVKNVFFDAAAYAYSEQEFKEFSAPSDHRPKTWLLMDKALVEKLSGFGV